MPATTGATLMRVIIDAMRIHATIGATTGRGIIGVALLARFTRGSTRTGDNL